MLLIFSIYKFNFLSSCVAPLLLRCYSVVNFYKPNNRLNDNNLFILLFYRLGRQLPPPRLANKNLALRWHKITFPSKLIIGPIAGAGLFFSFIMLGVGHASKQIREWYWKIARRHASLSNMPTTFLENFRNRVINLLFNFPALPIFQSAEIWQLNGIYLRNGSRLPPN